MIPPITREDHYTIMQLEPDNIGYCYEMWKMKTGQSMPIAQWVTQFQVWLMLTSKLSLTEGCEYLFKHFKEKFA